ncbi:hypothetical protein [Hyalangium versicolor]|uniref:hypothetical protein n=1 Tax=Hyalangium versicolor TaxID=2861190 RepID=UPI001CCE9C97|nr:hypothetical protein [Hyalangium versicolor]
MNRTFRKAALLGGLLLGAGCTSDNAGPPESPFIPVPKVTQYQPRTSRVSGFAWDPEAWFMNVANCGNCGIPPFILDNSPLFLRSSLKGATVLPFDPTTGAPAADPVQADDGGLWTLPSVASRTYAPYFITALPTGTLNPPPFGPPLPAIPSGGYVPTVTLRPVFTHNSICAVQEAASLSTVGILEAVAKHLSVVDGTPTLVTDLLNPGRFANVAVFWLFQPGSPLLRGPAGDTTVEASAGRVLHIDWAPPGTPPANLRSTRGYIVTDAATSPLGITVVLLAASGTPPPVIHYEFKDTAPADPVTGHPWFFPPIDAPPTPTVINYSSTQLWRADEPNGPAGPTPPYLCLPQ